MDYGTQLIQLGRIPVLSHCGPSSHRQPPSWFKWRKRATGYPLYIITRHLAPFEEFLSYVGTDCNTFHVIWLYECFTIGFGKEVI